MDRRLSRRELIASGLAGVAGLSGCLGGSGGDQGNDNNTDGNQGPGFPLRIGVLSPQSGELARMGGRTSNVLDLIQSQVEASSEHSFTLEYEIRDTESDPDTAAGAASDLVDKGYQAIAGPALDEAVKKCGEEVFVPETVISCSPFVAAPEVLEMDDDDLMYSVGPTAQHFALGLGRLPRLDGITTVGILNDTSLYGSAIARRTIDEITTRGNDIAKQVEIEPGQDSYSSAVNTVMDAEPEGLMVLTGTSTGRTVLQDFYAEFEEMPIYIPDRIAHPDLRDQVESDMATVQMITQMPHWSNTRSSGIASREDYDMREGTPTGTQSKWGGIEDQRRQAFAWAYYETYDEIPIVYDAQIYDSVVTLLLAITSKVGVSGEEAYDGEEIKDVIRKVNNDSPSQATTTFSYSHDDFWEGLPDISDGIKNDYDGATVDHHFTKTRGNSRNQQLEALKFAPDDEFHFEQVLPIYTNTAA